MSVLDMTQNHLIVRVHSWSLGNVEYPFMTITPRSTLIQCLYLCESNQFTYYIHIWLNIIDIFWLHIFCKSFRIAILILWYSAGIAQLWAIIMYYKSDVTFVCTLILCKKSVCTVVLCSVRFYIFYILGTYNPNFTELILKPELMY